MFRQWKIQFFCLCFIRCQSLSCQAHQDILAQDLAEALDSQAELAEQLRCYREDNEKLLTEKQMVCFSVLKKETNNDRKDEHIKNLTIYFLRCLFIMFIIILLLL